MKRTVKRILPNPRELPLDAATKLVAGANTRRFVMGDCSILLDNHPQVGWHLSISCKYRYPSLDEIGWARYKLTPNEVTMVMIWPPMEEYVNLHDNCFHLWELKVTAVKNTNDGQIFHPSESVHEE